MQQNSSYTPTADTICMNDFDRLCKTFEDLDPASYSVVLAQKSKDVLEGLAAVTGDVQSAVDLYVDIVLMAISADGKLDREEYILVEPGLSAAVGQDITYDDARRIFAKANLDARDNKAAVDEIVDMVGQVSPEIKDDIVLLTLIICSVDGKVSGKEKAWIRQLIRE
jgi:hypothetical protein